MCDTLNAVDRTHMIYNLAESLKCLATRPEDMTPMLKSKCDDTSRRLLEKINSLLEEV